MASDQLKGGRLDDLGDSLAEYLEEAFDFIRVHDYDLEHLAPEGQEERMMLFLGLGRGIVRYLAEHAAAFVVDSHTSDGPDATGSRHGDGTRGHVGIRFDPQDDV